MARKGLVIGGIIALLAAGLFVGSALVTDRPGFCPTCHEMRPYYDRWSNAAHDDVWCIDCHVGSGMGARLGHKFEALKEVAAHFSGDNRFPRPLPASVPDERCLTCHPNPQPKGAAPGFSHGDHARKAPCQRCHETAGHRVGEKELRAAGVYDEGNAAVRADMARKGLKVAVPGGGSANVAGHVGVTCSRCHDMAATGCPACHAPPSRPNHAGRVACAECHEPGAKWAFAHPAGSDCRKCHKPPANHFGSDCGRCHSPGRRFAEATFTHPRNTGEHSWRSFPCAKCHPKTLAKASCTCHGGGIFHDD